MSAHTVALDNIHCAARALLHFMNHKNPEDPGDQELFGIIAEELDRHLKAYQEVYEINFDVEAYCKALFQRYALEGSSEGLEAASAKLYGPKN